MATSRGLGISWLGFSFTTDLGLHSLGWLTCSQFCCKGVPYLEIFLKFKWPNDLKLWLLILNFLRSSRCKTVMLLLLFEKYIWNTFHKNILYSYVTRVDCYYSVWCFCFFFLIRHESVPLTLNNCNILFFSVFLFSFLKKIVLIKGHWFPYVWPFDSSPRHNT